ncbi:hypothetical protein LINPERPRIM_LOCUS18833, partial [Linum perenne]
QPIPLFFSSLKFLSSLSYILLTFFSRLLSNTKSRTHKKNPFILTLPGSRRFTIGRSLPPLHHRKVDSSPLLPPSASAPRLQPSSKKSTIAAVQVVGSASVSPDACRAVVPLPTVDRRHGYMYKEQGWMMID